MTACSLQPDDLAARQTEWHAVLSDALVGAARRPTGIELRLRGDDEVFERVRALVDAERSCCAFLGWALARGADEIVLDIAGPDGTEPVFDGWEGAFSAARG